MSGAIKESASYYLSASAGSGKTYRLSMRFCALLVAGVPPEAICALTFTRAATREIFTGVVERLLEAPKELQGGKYTPQEALVRLLAALPRLQISTIDAFAAKIARLFAYELGLNPDFTLYESDESIEAQEIVREVIRRALEVSSPQAAGTLLQQFNLTQGGRGSGASLTEELTDFFRTYGELAERLPEGWGDRRRLQAPLPGGTEPHLPAILPDEARAEALETLLALLDSPRTAGLSDRAAAKFASTLQAYDLSVTSVREQVARGLKAELREAFFKPLETGGFSFGRAKRDTVPFSVGELTALRRLRDDLTARDFEQTAAYTERLFPAVAALNRAAEMHRRESGQLALGYLVKVLSQRFGGELSFVNPDLLYVTYRLDSAVSHLMIDEFQDTSVEQWNALRHLAEELASDPDHSFYYVGDVKQSIYGWRGGDSTLFGDPERVPDIPQGDELLVSYRSAPAVISLVNRLMAYDTYLNPAAVKPWQSGPLADWKALWKPHAAHSSAEAFAAVVSVEERSAAARLDAVAAFVARRWHELSARNLTFAVLARRNKLFTGDAADPGLLGRLRKLGVRCAIDGKRAIADTPAGRLVLMMLRRLADPRDTFVQTVLSQVGLETAVAEETLEQWFAAVHEKGFAAWLNGVLGPESPCTIPFSDADREILAAAVQVLDEVDARNCTDPAVAEAAVQAHRIPCADEAGMLSLMTIHHSKGLTRDVVFTILDGDFITETHERYESGADWVLVQPALSETYEAYPQLEAAATARREARFKDSLCGLYVAVTRARFEEIVILGQTPKEETGYTRSDSLFRAAVADGSPEPDPEIESLQWALQIGNREWWHRIPLRETSAEMPADRDWVCERVNRQPEVELPSERARTTSVAEFFAEGADDARLFGIEVHDRLAAVAWSDSPPEGLFPEVFRRPDEPCELWRERAFSVKVSDSGALRYYAGQFDRVHLFPQSRRAVIYDFKTSREAAATPAYCRQLRDYSRALTALTGYPPESIRMVLLFTRSGKTVEVPRA